MKIHQRMPWIALGIVLFQIRLLPFVNIEKQTVALEKIGEIKEGFSSGENDYFWKISGICCDENDNLYVLDSGHNKIFVFSSNGKYRTSFGKQGQGPGEWMGTKTTSLTFSLGNDGCFYICDPANGRISVFSKDGKYLKSIPLKKWTYDYPIVNSQGDLYLLSQSGIKMIDCYDRNFKYQSSIVEREFHYHFPYRKPSVQTLRAPLTYFDLRKQISKKDDVVVLSNYSWRVAVYDKNNKQKNEFEINNKLVMDDYLQETKSLKKNQSVVPFNLFLMDDVSLCIAYMKIKEKTHYILRYSLAGDLINLYQLPERYGSGFCADGQGRLYAAKMDRVDIYKGINPKKEDKNEKKL